MPKQHVPQYWTMESPPPPYYKHLFDWLRRYAFGIVSLIVVAAYLSVFHFFSGDARENEKELALLRTIAATEAKAETSGTHPNATATSMASIDYRPRSTTTPAALDSASSLPQPRPAEDTVSTLRDDPPSTPETTPAPPVAPQTKSRNAERSEQPPSQPSPSTQARRPAKRTQPARQSTPDTPGARQQQAEEADGVTGKLIITSQPSGAEIRLDGETVGNTPLTSLALSPGLYKVTFHSEGYETYTTRVLVKPRQTSTLHGQLTVPMGNLEVRVEPGGSMLYVDASLRKRDMNEPLTMQLTVGPHRIKAVHPTLGTWENVVYISKDRAQQVAIIFNQPVATQSTGREAARPATSQTTNETLSARPAETNPSPPTAAAKLQVQPDENGIYPVAEVAPVLIGGLAELHRKVHYPEKAYQAGLEGRVYIQFVVDEKGHVHDPTIARGLGLGCNAEALRALKQARFKPGTIGGQPVKTRHALYIEFKIGP